MILLKIYYVLAVHIVQVDVFSILSAKTWKINSSKKIPEFEPRQKFQ